MKITKSRLKEIIQQELREFTTTAGGTAATKKTQTAKKNVQTKRADKRTKKSAWDTKKKTKSTKQSTYNTKASAVDAFSTSKYRKVNRAAKGGYDYSKNPIKGGEVNPDWTTKNNAKTAALSAKSTADTEAASAETDYNTAVSDLTSAEREEKARKAATHWGYSAGAGGRKGGKAGTAKGKGKASKKGKKDESLFRILGRKLVNELNEIKKYS